MVSLLGKEEEGYRKEKEGISYGDNERRRRRKEKGGFQESAGGGKEERGGEREPREYERPSPLHTPFLGEEEEEIGG